MKMLELLIINAEKVRKQFEIGKLKGKFRDNGILEIYLNSHSRYYFKMGSTKWYIRDLLY